MRKVKENNIIYLISKNENTMDLRCSSCGIVRNELDVKAENNRLVCECGSSSFIPQCDLEEIN